MPALRPQQCPSSVYKAAEAHKHIAASEGPPSNAVPRRHAADGSVQSRVEGIREVSATAPAAVGVQHQLGQICSLPYTEDLIPRVHGEFNRNVHITTKGESHQNQTHPQAQICSMPPYWDEHDEEICNMEACGPTRNDPCT